MLERAIRLARILTQDLTRRLVGHSLEDRFGACLLLVRL